MYEFMLRNFDYWIVIEGLASPNDSTSWCKDLKLSPRSTDGTHEFMESLSRSNTNVIYHSPGQNWRSKDAMVNEAVMITRLLAPDNKCYLWQVDADEIWTSEQLDVAESELSESNLKAGAFQFNHYLCKTDDGRQLIGVGEWGSGYNIRLWKWRGERFISHEPPRIEGQNASLSLSPKYEHYAYYFEQDVVFKSMYYGGHEQVYKGWLSLQKYRGELPVEVSMLFGAKNRKFDPGKSFIDQIKTETCQSKNVAVVRQDPVQVP